MNTNLKSKLKEYTALAAAALSSTAVSADIVYYDINPDTVLDNNNDAFAINFNGGVDNSIAFVLKTAPNINYVDMFASYGMFYEYFLPGGNAWWMLKNFSYGSCITASLVDYQTRGLLGWVWYTYTDPALYSTGYFNKTTDGYVGFQFWKSGNVHNAWVRLDVDTNFRSLTIKDYAYNDNPNECIKAGQMPVYADTCRNLLLENLAANGNASDLQVSFDTAASEMGIKEYQVYVFLERDSANITTDKLRSSSFYTSFPTGNNVTAFQLDEATRDFRGNSIIGDTTYRFVVLSVPDDSLATNHVVSQFSNPVTLPIFPADVANNIVVQDISDYCNSSDMEICYDSADDEMGIAEYRIMVVKSEDQGSFDVDQAENTSFYFTYPTGSNSACRVLYPYARDVDGDTITVGREYVIYILSYGNQKSHFSSLSQASSPITLSDQCLNDVPEMLFRNTNVVMRDKQLNILTDLRGLELSIYDLTGKEVLNVSAIDQQNISLGHLNEGVFIIHLRHQDGQLSKKVLLR